MFNPITAAARILPAMRAYHAENPIKTSKDFAAFLDDYGAEVIELDKTSDARIKKARENAEKSDKKKKAAKKKRGR